MNEENGQKLFYEKSESKNLGKVSLCEGKECTERWNDIVVL